MESKNNPNYEFKEIDLTDLSLKFFSKIKSTIKKIINFLLFLMKLTIKFYYIFFLFIILSIIFGYLIHKITPDKYFSDLLIKTNGFTIDNIEPSINYFKNLCKTKNYKLLSNYLKIDIKTASKIKNIEVYYYIDINNDNIGDILTNKQKLIIDTTKGKKILTQCLIKFVYTSKIDTFSLNKLEKEFVNVLCQNEYVKTLFLTFINEKKDLIYQLDNEINKLDSLQKVEYFIEKTKPFYFGGSNMAIISQQPTQLYYKDILNLTETKNEVIKIINISKEPITVIQKFTSPLKIHKKVSNYIIFSFVIHLIIFYIITFSIIKNQKINILK